MSRDVAGPKTPQKMSQDVAGTQNVARCRKAQLAVGRMSRGWRHFFLHFCTNQTILGKCDVAGVATKCREVSQGLVVVFKKKGFF
jgi:hypothetical protein